MVREAGHYVLRTTLTSPFGRKLRMAADVLGLSGRIDIQHADTADAEDTLRRQNPLGKIPCMLLPDGSSLYDSGVILEFLQHVAGTERLIPMQGAERFPMFTLTRLADGIIDAGAIIIYEERYHPEAARSAYWTDYQREKIMRALAAFEASPPDPARTDAVSIGLACALGFLDKRKLVDWRPGHPALAAWLDAFARSEPAFDRTRPPES